MDPPRPAARRAASAITAVRLLSPTRRLAPLSAPGGPQHTPRVRDGRSPSRPSRWWNDPDEAVAAVAVYVLAGAVGTLAAWLLTSSLASPPASAGEVRRLVGGVAAVYVLNAARVLTASAVPRLSTWSASAAQLLATAGAYEAAALLAFRP